MSDGAVAEDAGPLTCAKCGCSSTLRALFVHGKDGTVARTWCPRCAEKFHERNALIMLGCCVFSAACLVFLMTRRSHAHVPPLTLGALAYVLTTTLMVLPHEVGHALIARLVGFRPIMIRIGLGRLLVNRNLLGVRLQVGWTLGGGTTTIDLRPIDGFRLRKLALTAAGPAVNLIAGLAALTIVLNPMGDAMSSEWRAVLIGFAFGNLALVGSALVPRLVRSPSGLIPTDGAQILGLLRGEVQDHEANAIHLHLVRANLAYHDRDYPGAQRELVALESLGGNLLVQAYAAALRAEAMSESGEARAAIQLLERLRSRTDLPAEGRVALDSAHAWAAFLCDEPLRARDGLQYAQSCVSLLPWDPVLQIKHICLLSAFPTEVTAVREARRLVNMLKASRLQGESRAYAALARGMVAAAEGNRDLASEELERARRQRVSPPALAILQRRLA